MPARKSRSTVKTSSSCGKKRFSASWKAPRSRPSPPSKFVQYESVAVGEQTDNWATDNRQPFFKEIETNGKADSAWGRVAAVDPAGRQRPGGCREGHPRPQ